MAKKTVKKKAAPKADGVPSKVAQQEADAEELQRRLIAGEDLKGDPVKVAKEDGEGNLIVDELATAQAANANAQDKSDNEPAPAAAQEFPRVDPGSVDVKPAADANANAGDSDLQQRLNVLEGKYNSEVGRLTTALKSYENIIAQQEAFIKSLQAGGNASQAAPAASDATQFEKLNPDDYSSYGSEMEQMAATVNKLVAENQRLVGLVNQRPGTQGENDRIAKVEQTVTNLAGTVQLSAKQTYYQALDNAIVDANHKPEWERINHDPKFAAWLAQEEPLTGIPRKAILIKANKEMNAERVISIFTEFKRSLQAGGMPNSQAAESGLASQAVPGAAAGSESDSDQSGQRQGLVTTEMFTKSKNDFIQGRITEADFDKVSNGYQMSIGKGWVQPGS